MLVFVVLEPISVTESPEHTAWFVPPETVGIAFTVMKLDLVIVSLSEFPETIRETIRETSYVPGEL